MSEKIVGGLLIVGAIALVGYGLYRSMRHWCQQSKAKEVKEASEPLIKEDLYIGETLRPKRPRPDDERQVTSVERRDGDATAHTSLPPGTSIQYSRLSLEVISGPSSGVCIVRESAKGSGLTLTLGRVPQNDLVLNDPEVSGKHGLISWNSKASKWEIVDMGSLNGTLLNHQSIAATQDAKNLSRQRGNPVGLSNGDIVTLGSSSEVLVKSIEMSLATGVVEVCILNGREDVASSVSSVPFGVGVAADSMTMRKGGRKLAMEDVCHYEWPLRGVQEFGVFCVFDGHGGAAAAEAASRLMPQKLSNLLSAEDRRGWVLMNCNAESVLREAFKETEAALNYEYEGCTATVLLVWLDAKQGFYAQCANVGDSACVFSIADKVIPMTEDHRVTSLSERSRLLEMGKQLKEGETRICGMNIARALGDKFLKEQEESFSADPYVSEVLRISNDSRALGIIASDGLWDVLSPKRALQLAIEAHDEKTIKSRHLVAEGIAELLVGKARLLRTRDNTTVVILDFGFDCRSGLCKQDVRHSNRVLDDVY